MAQGLEPTPALFYGAPGHSSWLEGKPACAEKGSTAAPHGLGLCCSSPHTWSCVLGKFCDFEPVPSLSDTAAVQSVLVCIELVICLRLSWCLHLSFCGEFGVDADHVQLALCFPHHSFLLNKGKWPWGCAAMGHQTLSDGAPWSPAPLVPISAPQWSLYIWVQLSVGA